MCLIMILIGVEMYVLYVVDLNYKGVCFRMIFDCNRKVCPFMWLIEI